MPFEIPPGPFAVVSRYAWIGLIVVTSVNVRCFLRRRRGTDESGEATRRRLLRNALIWSNAPWLLMGAGILAGWTEGVFDYLFPLAGNPWVAVACSEHSMPSRTCGSPNVDVHDLVRALLSYDALTARQWVSDARRSGFNWSGVERPTTQDPIEGALTAAVVELLASRAGQTPPSWTQHFAAAPEPVFLVDAARTMRRLRTLCEQEGPEPLRKRRFLAPPDFLEVA